MVTNNKRRSAGDKAIDIFIIICLVLLSIACLFPLYQVFVVSVSSPNIVMKKNAFLYFPEGFNVEAYKIVFSNKNIRSGFMNTLLYISVGTVMNIVTTSLTAYTLSKKNVLLKKPLMIYFSITMYFGGGLIPMFLLINGMHLMNSHLAILLPGAFSVWNMIIMRTQFVSIPDELKESAMLDGASDMVILTRILLPLSGSVIAVLSLFSIVGFWNMWYEPMIYLTERSKYPLQSVLREILIDSSTQMMAGAGANKQLKMNVRTNSAARTLVKYANIIVCTVPILVVYPFLQKYFVKGMLVGSLKG